MHTLFFFLLLFSHVPSSHSLHGAAPPDYKNKGDILEVKVNKLSSAKTQLPYDYYSLRYCKPPVIINSSLSLGQALRGDLIKNSVYNFKMKEAEYCKVVCRVKLDEASAKSFKEKIDDEYQINLTLDDLPVAVVRKMIDVPDERGQSNIYVPGFQVGLKAYYAGSNEGRQFIHNHLSFKVKYHEDPGTDYAHIVGFEVTPYSIVHEYKEWEGEKTKLLTCTPANNTVFRDGNALQEVDADREVVFTYDVSFEPTEVKWGSRWDTYHSIFPFEDTHEGNRGRKRKEHANKSPMWQYFTKCILSNGEIDSKYCTCNYCHDKVLCLLKKNWTSSMKYHNRKCQAHPLFQDTDPTQARLN